MASLRWDQILYIAYLTLGPVVWILFAIGMYSSRKRINLAANHIAAPPALPSVSILIPAKDEGQRIRDCILSAIQQDYPNLEVIAIDDRSTDCTGAVMDELAAANPKLRVVHIPHGPVPVGWTGKNNALHSAVGHARGEWLLFVDSDVILEPDALFRSIAIAAGKRFDLLSLMPRLESHTFWEGMLVPLAGTALSGLFLVPMSNSPEMKKLAFANGQFMLFRRSAYEAVGGHASVRDRFCEDIDIARLMKSQGLRPRTMWGFELATVRMYDSFPRIIRGWARIFYAGDSGKTWRIWIGILFVLLCCFSVYAAGAFGLWRIFNATTPGDRWAWIITALVHWATLTGCLAVSYRWTGNKRRNALLFPIGGVLLLGIFLRALQMCLTGKIEWRGTSYAVAADGHRPVKKM